MGPFIVWTTGRILFFCQKGFKMSIPYCHRQERKGSPRYRSGDETEKTPEKIT